MKFPHLAFVFVIIFAALFFCKNAIASPFRIGIPIPLTGDTAMYGEDIRRGFLLAKELLNASDVELIFEDDECSATKGVSIVNKLINVNHVQVVSGMFCNSILLAAAPVFNRSGIPVLTSGANPGDQKGIGKKIFRLFPADHLGVPPLMQFISKRHKSLCMITETEAYPELVSRTAKTEWIKYGAIHQLFSEAVNFGEKDFRAALLRLKQRNCEALFINTVADDGYIAAHRQAKALSVAPAIYAYYMPGSPAVQKALGKDLEGVIYATLPSHNDLASNIGITFHKLYKERYGEFLVAVPSSLFAFESLRLILAAKLANTPLDIYLRNRIISDGAFGPYSFDGDGALQGVEFKIYQIENGTEIVVR
jgi:branched-chain amino acid transport system substrate-binding protein